MKFTFKPSPNYRDSLSTQGIMRDLTIGLLVVFAFSLFHYATGENLGVSYAIRAVGLLATSIISAEVTEAIYFVITKQPVVSSLKNSFGWVTAIILTLMCPINITYYALAVSTILAIFFGKLVFGGFGQNIFNPAALGRAIVMSSFAGSVAVDFATSATPTASFASAGWEMANDTFTLFIAQFGGLFEMFVGRYAGAIGETSALVILLVGAFLVWRKVIDWKVPVTYLVTIFVTTLLIGLVNGEGLWYPLFHLLTGGVMFGAIFMLTDPVTNPTSSAGRVIFAMGAAFLTVLIRIKANLPEGVLYSILLMNMLSPAIERLTTGNQIKTLAKNVRSVVIIAVAGLVVLVGLGSTLEAKEVRISVPTEDIEGIEGVAAGFGGDVKVIIATDDNGIITKVVAEGKDETETIGGAAIDKFNAEYFNSLQGVALAEADFDALDSVSGATITSTAIKNALKNARGEEVSNLALGSAYAINDDYSSFNAKIDNETADGNLVTYTIRVKGYGLIDPEGHAGESGHEYARNYYDVTVDKDTMSITSVKMTSFGDTEGIGDKVNNEEYLALFEGATLDSEIDTISGATWTSKSVHAACKAALEAANQ